jgi:hypothetical protein
MNVQNTSRELQKSIQHQEHACKALWAEGSSVQILQCMFQTD